MKHLQKIISGGQTGVDRAALDAAIAQKFPCGGWCPEERLAEDGAIPDSYPLDILPGASYEERTLKNLTDSDGTLVVYFNALTGGTAETFEWCRERDIPVLSVDASRLSVEQAALEISTFISKSKIEILNIAGPRASKQAGAYDYAFNLLTYFLLLQQGLPFIERIDRIPIIKHIPSDFVVKEVYIPKDLSSEMEEQEYFLLRKRGFTTFEAIEKIAESLGCEGMKISYAGLKDEDGITEQHIGISREYAADAVQDIVAKNENGDYITLRRSFQFGPPIEIGKLIGNAFRVVVRKLAPELEENIQSHRKAEYQFLNYYDTQRFGIPNAPKNTHLVGQQLVLGNYDQAFLQLLASGTREAAKAENWNGDPKDFFDSLDPRMCSFYYSAAASSIWNNDIMQAIDESDAVGKRDTFRDGIRYVFSSDPAAVLAAQVSAKEKPMIRYARSEEFAQTGTEERPAVIQTRFRLVDLGPDEHHPGYIQAAFEYFLPSGCYATMAMDQFVSHLEDTSTSSDQTIGRV